MEVNSNKENTQINPHIQSGSFNELTFNKKVVWIILNLLLLLCFLGVAYSGGKALLANTFLPYIVFLVIFDLPIIALFIIFMFLPSLIPNRVIVSILALVFFVIFYLVTPSIAPVTYLWPQVIVAILYYLTTFGLFILVIYPLGKLYSQIGLRFLIQYQSPKTISNLVYSGPSNLIYSFQGQILRIIAVIFLIFIIGISVHITVSQPSIWGIGVFDLPSSFPTMSSFQAQTESKFFNTPLGTNYSIQQYVRNPVSSMCWSQLPQDIANNYPLNRPVTQEFKIMDTTTNSEIGLATIKSSCSLNSDSLRQETQGNVSIYKYSDSYLNIEFPGVQDLLKYPSYATSASSISISSAGQILPVQRVIDQERSKFWIRKGNVLICADSTNEENQIVTLINNFKTEVSTSDQCPTQSVITTPNTPGKLVFVFKLNFSKDQMLQILSSYGATVCVNKWKNNDWSFVCNVTVGTEDAVINRAKNDQNLDSVSKTAFK